MLDIDEKVDLFSPIRIGELGVNELFGTLKELFGVEIDEGIWQEAKILAGKFFTAANQLNQL